MKERALVAFTLLAQTAVGAFWTLAAVYLLTWRQVGPATARLHAVGGFVAVGALLVLAMGASLLHLGSPLLAWRALANPRTSWLSREIWSTLLLSGASILWAGLLWFERGAPFWRSMALGAAALLGLALLLTMSWAYRLRTVPAWNSWVTPLSFLVTTLLLGGLAAGLSVALIPPLLGTPAVRLPGLPVGVILLLCVEFLLLPLWLVGLAGRSPAARAALALLVRRHRVLLQLRLILMVVAVGLAGLLLTPWNGPALFLALAGVAAAAEVLGRILFYAAYAREGV